MPALTQPNQPVWHTELEPYVAGSAADIRTNNRDVARFYVSNAADITMDPMVTLASHIAVGGTAIPASFAATCIGAAEVSRDPCGDGDFAADLLDTDVRVVNLNLAPERRRIIERVREEFLEPVVALVEDLSPDVCVGVIDGTYDITDAELPDSVEDPPTGTDPWGNPLSLTKQGAQWVVRSNGPPGTPANNATLVATAACRAGDDLTEDFRRVRDAILGAAQSSSPRALPANYAGLTVDTTDPWGNDLAYQPAGSGFTLTSRGPDGADDGGADDDVVFTVSTEEVVGHFARLGIHFPGPDTSPGSACDTAQSYLTVNCDTVIEYLLNAAQCNNNAVQHRDLGCP